MVTKSVLTLNARGNIMLEVMRDYFSLPPERMFFEIQGMLQMVERALKVKRVKYYDLKSTLVPKADRREIALVFDSSVIESSWYAYEIFKWIIPLFDKKSNHSVLVGDYLAKPSQMQQLYEAFIESVDLRHQVEFRHPTQFFIVYINNLSDVMIERFDKGLSAYEPYVGMADMTYASRFKLYLSTMLINAFIKHERVIIQGHEPDRQLEEDVNMLGYPFEESGYVCRSISSDLKGVLLSYKIERPVFTEFQLDTEFSLNAVCVTSKSLSNFRVEVEEAKLKYLKDKKSGSLAMAGLTHIDSSQLAEIIRQKLSYNYIYCLDYNAEYKIIKFNIIIELRDKNIDRPVKLVASLEYRHKEMLLRLITLF